MHAVRYGAEVRKTAASATATLPLFQVTSVSDATALARLDPMLRLDSVFVLIAPNAPVALPCATIEPVDAGIPTTLNITLAFYEALLDVAGVEDTGEVLATYDAEADEAARPVVASMPSGALADFRGEGTARRRMAAGVARRYLVGPRAGKTLYPAGDLARAADIAKAQHAEAEARAAALAEASRAVAEAEALAVPKDYLRVSKRRLGVTPDMLTGTAPPPFPGALPVHEDPEAVYYGWARVEGMPLPAFDADGISSVADLPAPVRRRPVPEASAACAGFLVDVRARLLNPNMGPVASFSEPSEESRDFAKRYAHYITTPRRGEQWRVTWCAEMMVRHYAIRPDLAAVILAESAAGVSTPSGAPGPSMQFGRKTVPNPAYVPAQPASEYLPIVADACAAAVASGAYVGAPPAPKLSKKGGAK